MISKANKNATRKKRHGRVRRTIIGTAARPRLNVFRSNKNIYVQVIDDATHATLASASSLDLEKGNTIDAASAVGKLAAERALEKGIETVVFDRGGYLYHGRIKAVAEAAREAGLKF